MGHRWAQWAGDDLLFSLGVTPVCKCGIRTPWENERLPAAASKRNLNVKTLWCCDVRIWNVGSDRLMVLISFGWIREQCHLAYIMTEEWSQQLTAVQRRAATVASASPCCLLLAVFREANMREWIKDPPQWTSRNLGLWSWKATHSKRQRKVYYFRAYAIAGGLKKLLLENWLFQNFLVYQELIQSRKPWPTLPGTLLS